MKGVGTANLQKYTRMPGRQPEIARRQKGHNGVTGKPELAEFKEHTHDAYPGAAWAIFP